MATVTKTFTENSYYYPSAATWTVTVTHADMTVSESTFKWTAPTVTAKYVKANRNVAIMYILSARLGTSTDQTAQVGGAADFGSYNSISLASNVSKTLSFANVSGWGMTTTSVNTSSIFNSNNRNSKVAKIYLATGEVHLESFQDGASNYGVYAANSAAFGPLFNLTLNAPPTVAYDPPTYSSPQYAGLGSYSIDVTQAKAQYQGYVSSITLTVGTDSTTQTYAATTVTNQTLSVTPTVAGTYTPTLTVTDTRGQTTTVSLPQITVNPYNAPSLDFDVFRTNSSGVRDDEGTYGLVTANISFTDAVADITEPTAQINGTTTSNVTWYSAYNASTGVSSAISDWSTVSDGDTIYGLINGSFTQTDSYQITITLEDSLGGTSSAITQTLSTAFYTIDFQAGGKEISFGGPANDTLTTNQEEVGLFKCGMEAEFDNIVDFEDYTYYKSVMYRKGSSVDNSASSQSATVYDNALRIDDKNGARVGMIETGQQADGTTFISINSHRKIEGTDYYNGIQFKINNTGGSIIYVNSPQAFRDALGIADFVVAQGTSNSWNYRKWNNGTYECWRIYSTSIAVNTQSAGYGGYRSAQLSIPTYPITFTATPVVTAIIGSGSQGAWINNCQPSTTGGVFYLSAAQSQTASTRGIHFHVIGKWK